ncbi:putative isoflavone reductase family protein [Lasiodiplodia theobromae]|uniref:Isoflavone reductase family protein n=1 Tax=Lasiodiplodia theobromae TaxID=45133 RepID=UPI0015C39952|nr:Isoflavone reductase family protein [Lasiodiplodia theobromae]KAF4545411.1 Isoflavone reductase family protein [Lasiodiplodia theobromae]KAF9639154.1 putative isoflavone reductase family protein [Lasiodiplodia theobromae]
MPKQKVLLLGATGETGKSILEGLLENPLDFQVDILVRPSSAAKPQVKAIAERGVSIRIADIAGPVDELAVQLEGVDILISAIDARSLLSQIDLATAAKKAGVKRFVPCNFASITPPGGVMLLRDLKEQVLQHVHKLFLPFTVIDVGAWYQNSFPTLPSGRLDYAAAVKPNVTIYGDGEAPNLVTDLRDIGRFVARIIADDRTLNKFVFTWGEVLTQKQIFTAIEAASGEKIEREHISESDLVEGIERYKQLSSAEPENLAHLLQLVRYEYFYSMHVRRDNTSEYAKYLGYLDARELYPDFEPRNFGDFVSELLEGKITKPYAESAAYEAYANRQ